MLETVRNYCKQRYHKEWTFGSWSKILCVVCAPHTEWSLKELTQIRRDICLIRAWSHSQSRPRTFCLWHTLISRCRASLHSARCQYKTTPQPPSSCLSLRSCYPQHFLHANRRFAMRRMYFLCQSLPLYICEPKRKNNKKKERRKREDREGERRRGGAVSSRQGQALSAMLLIPS